MNTSAEKQKICIYIGLVEDFSGNQFLPEYAKLKIAETVNKRKNAEKSAGYGLLQLAVRDMGLDSSVMECFLTEAGKPSHNDFAFSITHADGVVAVAVSLLESVGIDIEPKNNAERTDKLLDKIVFNDEKVDNSLVLWTKKEACFKYEGNERIFTPKLINTKDFNTVSIAFKIEEKDFVLSLAGNENFEVQVIKTTGNADLVSNYI